MEEVLNKTQIQKYPAYKNSGVEWLGEIPEHWEMKKITHLFEKIGSGTTPTSGDERYYDGEINFLQTGDLNDNKIYTTTKKLKERALKDFTTLKIYPVDSLVMAMYGATIGKLGILKIESTTNQACCVMVGSKIIYRINRLSRECLVINRSTLNHSCHKVVKYSFIKSSSVKAIKEFIQVSLHVFFATLMMNAS